MDSSENKIRTTSDEQGMDRDTFIHTFSDFEAARQNAAEAQAIASERKARAKKNPPAEFALFDGEGQHDILGMERKMPRKLHIWFAAGLGCIACFAALAQGLFTTSPHKEPKQESFSTQPIQDSEPPLIRLQQALADERRPDNAPDQDPDRSTSGTALHSGHRKNKHENLVASSSLTPSDLLADSPGQLSLGSANSSELMQRYETDKARALITGSKMLAVNHSNTANFGLDNLNATALTSRISGLVQAAPSAIRGISDWMSQSTHPSPSGPPHAVATTSSSIAIPALKPRPHTPGPLVLEGTAIPCVLLTEVRSDLPGMVVAQVSEDVFDSLRAEDIVIPRGARLIGQYDSHIRSGQQRLMASFHRLILLNGTSLDLEKMEGADIGGSAGLKGEVDTHFWARFGQAFLTAGLAHAAAPSASVSANPGFPASVLGPNAAGQILIDTTRVDLQANGLLQPTLLIHRGDPFVVMVNRDLSLPALPSSP